MSKCSKWDNYYPYPNTKNQFVNICTMGGAGMLINDTNNTNPPQKEKYDIELDSDAMVHINSINSSLQKLNPELNILNEFNGNKFIGDGLVSQHNPSSIADNPTGMPTSDNELLVPHFCTGLVNKGKGRQYCTDIGDVTGTVHMSNDVLDSVSSKESNPGTIAKRYGHANIGTYTRSEWAFKSLPGAENTAAVATKIATKIAAFAIERALGGGLLGQKFMDAVAAKGSLWDLQRDAVNNGLNSLANKLPNKYWKNIAVQGDRSCYYEDTNERRRVTFGCCNWSCGIVGGTQLVCERVAYNGDPAVCCLKDLKINNDIDNCWQTSRRQRTCAPRFRDLSKLPCIEAVMPFCTGEIMFHTQTHWTDIWTNKEININGLMIDDKYTDGSSDGYILTLTEDQTVVKKSNICKDAIVRWMFPNNETLTKWNQLKEINSDFILSTADKFGVIKTKELMFKIFDKYTKEGGSLFAEIDADGITIKGFVKTLHDICFTTPSLCEQSLKKICSDYTIRDFKNDPNILKWCGCYLDRSEYEKYTTRYDVEIECTPYCNLDFVIPLVSPNHMKKICTQSICIMDSMSLDIISSSIEGKLEFSQVCGGCTRNKTKNTYNLTDEHLKLTSSDTIKSNPYSHFNPSVSIITYLYANSIPRKISYTDPYTDLLLRYGNYGVDFQYMNVQNLTDDLKSVYKSMKNQTLFEPHGTDDITTLPSFSTIDREKKYVKLGVYQEDCAYFDEHVSITSVIPTVLNYIKDNSDEPITNDRSNEIKEVKYFHSPYICPVVLIKLKFDDKNKLKLYHQGVKKDLSTKIKDLSEYCFTFIDLSPGGQHKLSVMDINYLSDNTKGSNPMDANLVLVVPLSHLKVGEDEYNNEFDFTIDLVHTYYSNKTVKHSYFTNLQNNLHITLTENAYHNNKKIDLSNFIFEFTTIINKRNLTKTNDTEFLTAGYNIQVINTYPSHTQTGSGSSKTGKLTSLLEIENRIEEIGNETDIATCNCKMSDINIHLDNTKVHGDLKLSMNCTGDNTCYDDDGNNISCSAKLLKKLNVKIVTSGRNIKSIDDSKITLTNKPIDVEKIEFESFIENNQLNKIIITTDDDIFDEGDDYDLNFNNGIEYTNTTDYIVPEATASIIRTSFLDEAREDISNHQTIDINLEPNIKDIANEYIHDFFKNKYLTTVIILGVFLLFCIISFITMKPQKKIFKK